MTREQLREHVREWSDVIGLRAAARKFGVNEDTACVWAKRYNWPTPKVFALWKARHDALKAGVSAVREAQSSILRDQGEESRLYLSSAGLKASHEAATRSGTELLDRNTSQAVLNTARSLDVVHGWSVQTPQVSVQVANLVMPSEAEAQRTRELHARLDEITARLSASTPGAGAGDAPSAK